MELTTKERVKLAFRAMKEIGISEVKTKPVLKKLLNMFNKNWEAIEEENYRVLADAIFEYEEAETAEKEKKKPDNAERGEAYEAPAWQDEPMQDENMQDETERPLKRLRLKHQAQGGPSNGQPLKIPKPEPVETDTRAEPVQPLVRNKGKRPVSSHDTGGSAGRVQPSAALKIKEPNVERGAAPQINGLIKPKDEPFTDDAVSIEPLAVIHPEPVNNEASLEPSNQVGSQNGQISGTVDGLDKATESMASVPQEVHLQEADVTDRAPAILNIAASTLGNVQISLTCNPVSNGQEMRVPDLEAVLKKVNDSCLKTYEIMDRDFCVTKLMKQLCDSVEELGKNTSVGPEGCNGLNDHEM